MKKNAFFLLLTVSVLFAFGCFFDQPKKMNFKIPKDSLATKTISVDSLTTTILLDGNKEGIVFYYEGAFNSGAEISRFKSDTAADFKVYLQHADTAGKAFVIKWGGDAKYIDVINLIDQFKLYHLKKFALTKISEKELIALEKITGKQYPELVQ